MGSIIKLSFLLAVAHLCDGGSILCVFPTPTHGINSVYKILTQELYEKGHTLVILTTEPTMFEKQEGIEVIGFGESSHKIWAKKYLNRNVKKLMRNNYFSYYDVMLEITKEQLATDAVKKLLGSSKKKFDLLLVESYIPTWYAFADHFKIPIVAISPELPGVQDLANFGIPKHPYLYPDNSMFIRHDVENLSFWQRLDLFFNNFDVVSTFNKVYLPKYEIMARTTFGKNVSLRKIQKSISALIVNVHPLMMGIRPTVPGVVFTGNLHVGHSKELPDWLLEFMDSADHGVIYFSLGSNFNSQYLPEDKIKIFTEAFSELPYKFLWKWETKTLPGHPENVVIYDWTVQEDILANLKTMAIITAGGRHTIDEAIHYQVPMVGIPIFGDHHFNVAKMAQLGLGVQLDLNTLTKEDLKNAIVDVVNNETYKDNLIDILTWMGDEPIPTLDKATWWIEYVMRHGGIKHLKHKFDHVSTFRYFYLDVIFFLMFVLMIILAIGVYCGFRVKNKVFNRTSSSSSGFGFKKMT